MLETLLGFKDFGNTLPEVHDGHNTPHILQIRRQSLQVCNFVMGHLPGHQLRMEEIYRAQNTFRLRAILLRYFQEAGDWEDIAEGIELGINTTVIPPAGSVRPKETTLDDLLLQVHRIGKSVCGITNTGTSSRDDLPNTFDGPSPQPQMGKKAPMLSDLRRYLDMEYSNQRFCYSPKRSCGSRWCFGHRRMGHSLVSPFPPPPGICKAVLGWSY